MIASAYLIPAFIDVKFIKIILCRVWLSHSEHYHVLPIGVLVVSDVGDAVQRVPRKDTLLLVVCDLYAIFGQRDDLQVMYTGHPWHTTLSL